MARKKPPKQDWIDTSDPALRKTKSGAVACVVMRANGDLCGRPACVNFGSLHCKDHRGTAAGRGAKLSDAKARRMPKRLAEKYEQAMSDPELLSARSDAALLEARRDELIERLSTGESNEIWDDLHKTLNRFEEAGEDDADKVIRAMRLVVERGRTDEATWRQLHEAIEQKTKVSQAEWKRLVDMKQVITAEKAMAFSMQLLEIVMRHTPEEDRKRRIAGEVRSLMNIQSAIVIEAQ